MSYHQQGIQQSRQPLAHIRRYFYRLLCGFALCICLDANVYALPSAPHTANAITHASRTIARMHILQQQLLDTQHQSQQYFSQLEAQVQALQSQHVALRDHFINLQQKFQVAAQQLAAQRNLQLQPSVSQQWFSQFTAWTAQLKLMLGALGFKLATGLVAIFLLWLLWCLRPKKSKPASLAIPQSTDQSRVTAAASLSAAQVASLEQRTQLEGGEGEYDFLSSRDAIPTKLDLARAYIAMKNHSAARLVLQEVIMQGNSMQQQTAKTMWTGLEAEAP